MKWFAVISLPLFLQMQKFKRPHGKKTWEDRSIGRHTGVVIAKFLGSLNTFFGNDMEIPADNDVFYEGSKIFLPLVLTQYTPCQKHIMS